MDGYLNELNYIFEISTQLERFKTLENSKLFNYRCNICGDSHKNKFKARAYLFYSGKDDKFFFKCHNCGVTLSFEHYLKTYFPDNYKTFRLDKYLNKNKEIKQEYKQNNSYIEKLQKIKESAAIENKHLFSVYKSDACLQYLQSRLIPEDKFDRLYYTDNFANLVHSIDVNEQYKERNLPSDERLILLLKDEDGNIKGVQGRSLNNTSQLRYITCMLTDDNKIFGLEYIDKTKTVYVTEGAFDSLFLDNAISVNGGDANVLTTATSIPQENMILVFDNEPRHKDTTKRLESAINKNYRVVIWDKIGTELKDINDMVKSGITIDYIKNYIDENNYRGTKALVKFKHWKK